MQLTVFPNSRPFWISTWLSSASAALWGMHSVKLSSERRKLSRMCDDCFHLTLNWPNSTIHICVRAHSPTGIPIGSHSHKCWPISGLFIAPIFLLEQTQEDTNEGSMLLVCPTGACLRGKPSLGGVNGSCVGRHCHNPSLLLCLNKAGGTMPTPPPLSANLQSTCSLFTLQWTRSSVTTYLFISHKQWKSSLSIKLHEFKQTLTFLTCKNPVVENNWSEWDI